MRKLKKFWKESLILFGLIISLIIVFSQPDDDVRTNKYIISSQKGVFEYDLYEARTMEQKAQGLQNIYNLPPKSGMIFFFEGKESPTFWMKDTYCYLDIIYLDKDLKVLEIKPNQEPLSEEKIITDNTPHYVLELLGGESKYLNLAIGDQIKLKRPY